MKICIFPGTFNPIHTAHLRMAEFVLDNYKFDKVIFIPSYIPPHKDLDKNLALHRYNMVKLAIAGNKKFDISDIEYQSEGKSYSLITVKKIIEQYNIKGKVDFIIGELRELVHFIVFPREGYNINKEEFSEYDYELADMPKINVSSTELREKHGKGTEEKVEEYIKANGLYD